MGKAAAIITAAGKSRRMGTGVNKQLLSLCGKPVLEHAINALTSASSIAGVFLVVKPGEVSFFEKWSSDIFGTLISGVVPGGETRQDSVRKGVESLSPDTELVVIHDGARPLVEAGSIDKLVNCAETDGAATLGVPVKETVKKTSPSSYVLETVSREDLWLVQTPQAFRYEMICNAHKNAVKLGIKGTDDAGLVEAYGCPVKMLQGLYSNIKITTPEDILVAEAFISQKRSVYV
ncbi:MAG: 2-C-methyl-D-erythritol 4-phosphate cytidylyltransferase [Clostridiales bacterium]|nr:2-C-methyl-D-erythritol 4-phosphate cytidylyltransferase [Clostridiales bacterium]MCF8023637.1 2-C-methyl-D-erythritol 4-phosphate cytidylyltransferase [Clostridiales bacterium]